MAGEKGFYNNHERYDEWFEKNIDLFDLELNALKKFVPKKGMGLEIGVGTGQFASPLNIKFGIDPVEKMYLKAFKKGIKTASGKGEILPFKDRVFDYVLCVTTICFFDDILKSFKEAKRVLKINGAFILGFVDKGSWLGDIYLLKKDENPFYKEAVFYSVKEVIDILELAGFDNHKFLQTLFKDDEKIDSGYGKGGFAIIKSHKGD
jgi:SAM-dependent methyltransferase